jgi:hypothetical protein
LREALKDGPHALKATTYEDRPSATNFLSDPWNNWNSENGAEIIGCADDSKKRACNIPDDFALHKRRGIAKVCTGQHEREQWQRRNTMTDICSTSE